MAQERHKRDRAAVGYKTVPRHNSQNGISGSARVKHPRLPRTFRPDRHHLYLTAFATGFRVSELAALTPAHFHLTDDPPSVPLPGKPTNNKKAVRHPIPPAVARALRSYLVNNPPGQRVWGGKRKDSSAAMLRLDPAAAGVPYCVEGVSGNAFADIHALRHSFVTAISPTGIDAKSLQTLTRHSDPRHTLGVYTRSAELVKAISG
jgi:integrase